MFYFMVDHDLNIEIISPMHSSVGEQNVVHLFARHHHEQYLVAIFDSGSERSKSCTDVHFTHHETKQDILLVNNSVPASLSIQ